VNAAPIASNIDEVRSLARRLSNWGRWGPDDELGTLNLVTAEGIAAAAATVRRGVAISLAVALDRDGPHSGRSARFNPIHLMVRDGGDIAIGAGRVAGRHHQSADDVVIMPLQAGTQWDALAHIFDDGKMYNGYDAGLVSSRGAARNGIANAKDRVLGRAVLLDVPHAKGRRWLDDGEAISPADLDATCRAQHVEVRSGDIVLVRTGRMARVKAEGGWNGFADSGAQAPGLGLDCAEWLRARDVAAVAGDNHAVEVQPSGIEGVPLPLHLVCIVYMGLMFGEIFDLEQLAADCRADGRYECLFVGPPLPFSGAVGSPVNPIAIK
jgi:kynurenine formamidase